MDNRLQDLIDNIKILEKQLTLEIQKKQDEFFYNIKGKRVCFEKEVKRQHRALITHIHSYLFRAALLNILTAPVIWFCLVPALFLDLVVTVFHLVCFPVYGIPKVRRSDYIVIDRHALKYLNLIERLNCIYCGYFNGLIAYVQEMAARSEQYWCPIKHARKISSIHSRYRLFTEYGDAAGYRRDLHRIRNDFSDLKQ